MTYRICVRPAGSAGAADCRDYSATGGARIHRDLPPGNYDVFEQNPPSGATVTYNGTRAGGITVTVVSNGTAGVTVVNSFGDPPGDPPDDPPDPPGTGTLSVFKAVAGPVPAGTTFTYRVTCAGFALGGAGTFTIPSSGGMQPLGVQIPAGTQCIVTETGTGGAELVTVSVDGGPAVASTSTGLTVLAGVNRLVTFTNRYDDPDTDVDGPGFLRITKHVIGTPPAGTSFLFRVRCSGFALGNADTLTLPATGGSHILGVAIPEGTRCSVRESGTGGADQTLVAVDPAPGQRGGTGIAVNVTIAQGATRDVLFTNLYGADGTGVAGPGFLTVRKVVEGTAPAAATFTFAVSCAGFALGQAANFAIGAAGGAHEVGVAIPEGTRCTVTETDAGGAATTSVAVGTEAPSPGDTAAVTIGEATGALVEFVNSFDATAVGGSTVVRTPNRIDAGAGGALAGQGLPLTLLAIALTCMVAWWRRERGALWG